MKNKILVLISIFFTLIFLELFLSFFIFDKNNYDYKNRYLLFSGKNVFKNVDNFFTYYPNKKINAKNYYLKDNKFIEVYNYNIYTNNYGLAQKHNIKKNIKSLLFLGDSFTEGQGSESWIDKFGGSYNQFQIINGGLLGTGMQQFELIDNYLSEFNISKVFMIYLGDDLRRDIFQFSDQQIQCLNNYLKCNGSELFYGLPLNASETFDFLNSLKFKQNVRNSKDNVSFKKARRVVKSYFANLYIFKIPLDYLRSKFYKSQNDKIKRNFLAIDRLIKKYGENIYFVNLKMKQEILSKKRSYETIYLENYIKKKTNKYFKCDFDNNLDYFFEYDMHPNKKGYEYLKNCIKEILYTQLG